MYTVIGLLFNNKKNKSIELFNEILFYAYMFFQLKAKLLKPLKRVLN